MCPPGRCMVLLRLLKGRALLSRGVGCGRAPPLRSGRGALRRAGGHGHPRHGPLGWRPSHGVPQAGALWPPPQKRGPLQLGGHAGGKGRGLLHGGRGALHEAALLCWGHAAKRGPLRSPCLGAHALLGHPSLDALLLRLCLLLRMKLLLLLLGNVLLLPCVQLCAVGERDVEGHVAALLLLRCLLLRLLGEQRLQGVEGTRLGWRGPGPHHLLQRGMSEAMHTLMQTHGLHSATMNTHNAWCK